MKARLAGRRRRALVVAAGGAAAVVLGACGELDTDEAQDRIQEGILTQAGIETTVRCPDDVALEKGETFTCTATTDEGEKATVTVQATADNGTITWALAPGTPLDAPALQPPAAPPAPVPTAPPTETAPAPAPAPPQTSTAPAPQPPAPTPGEPPPPVITAPPPSG